MYSMTDPSQLFGVALPSAKSLDPSTVVIPDAFDWSKMPKYERWDDQPPVRRRLNATIFEASVAPASGGIYTLACPGAQGALAARDTPNKRSRADDARSVTATSEKGKSKKGAKVSIVPIENFEGRDVTALSSSEFIDYKRSMKHVAEEAMESRKVE